METFYFTFGVGNGQPYRGGWTVVEAESFKQAVAVFNEFHTKSYTDPRIARCERIYTQKAFERTKMFREGNLGAREHERIVLRREEAKK